MYACIVDKTARVKKRDKIKAKISFFLYKSNQNKNINDRIEQKLNKCSQNTKITTLIYLLFAFIVYKVLCLSL